MQSIEEINNLIKKKLESSMTDDELKDFLYKAKELYEVAQINLGKDDIIPYDILLLEHNISELESRSLAEENTNSFGRTR